MLIFSIFLLQETIGINGYSMVLPTLNHHLWMFLTGWPLTSMVFRWLLDFSEQSLTIVYKHIERPLANPMVLERPLQISFFCRISSPLNIFWYSMAFQWFLLSMVKNCWWNDGIVLNHRSGLGWALKRVWRWQQSLQECQIRLQSKSNCNRRTVNVTEHKVTTTTAKGCLYITF